VAYLGAHPLDIVPLYASVVYPAALALALEAPPFIAYLYILIAFGGDLIPNTIDNLGI